MTGVGGGLKSFGDVIALLELSFPKLDAAISGMKTAVGKATGIFGKSGAVISSSFKGIGALIKAHPITTVIGALTIAYNVAKMVDENFGISLKSSANILEDLKSESSELESELSSLNNEFDTTSEKIKELEQK